MTMQKTKQAIFAVVVGLGAGLSAAHATTDWNAANDAWRAQYRELAIAEAARERCDLKISKPVREAMKNAREGLRTALAPNGRVEKINVIVKAAGGRKAFCANERMMKSAQETVAKFTAAYNATAAMGDKTAPAAAGLSASAPTPVIDPNIPLIRNCRKAVIAKLGAGADRNESFWVTYEACMKDQGAGWF